MTEQTLRSAQQTIAKAISSIYEEDEALAIASEMLQDLLGISRSDVLSCNGVLSEKQQVIINEGIQRLLKYEPLQYVTGKAHFYGLEFKVNRHVLIPRPETEELVQLILQSDLVKRNPQLSILDIGTGSGCIPVTLKKNIPGAKVSAMDISVEALAVAKENATLNNVEVAFMETDILNWKGVVQTTGKWDIIVSNPPYITHTEKKKIHANVLGYEPHLALFVPDEDPLLFYQAISEFATQHLTPGGALYFEINAGYGTEVKDRMEQQGFTDVNILKDMQGKDRMVKGALA
jgi:release factor glutamine methyltransferase